MKRKEQWSSTAAGLQPCLLGWPWTTTFIKLSDFSSTAMEASFSYFIGKSRVLRAQFTYGYIANSQLHFKPRSGLKSHVCIIFG